MKPTLLCAACVIFASLYSVVYGTAVTNCEDVAVPDSVDIVGCDEQPCLLHLGDTVVTNIKFTAPQKLVNIAPHAIVTVYGINVTYLLPQVDACDGITNVKCPVDKGQEVDYNFVMDLTAGLPATDLTLYFSLIDQDNKDEPFECYSVDLQVRD